MARQQLVAARWLGEVVTLQAGENRTFDMGGLIRLSVREPTGSTVTVTRVDTSDAGAGGSDAVSITFTSDIAQAINVDWPFYNVATSGGPCQVVRI
jgi:hypothetical protein